MAMRAYNDSTIARVNLPDKIKCKRCEIKKGQAAFSNNRLNDLRREILQRGSGFNPTNEAFIACSSCTNTNVVELFCNGCDKTKGLNSFAKTQRRNPDNALCMPCSQDRQNMEPGGGSSDESSNSDDDDDSDDSTYGGGTTTVAGTFSNLSITNGTSTPGGIAVASMPSCVNGTSQKPTASSENSNGGVTVASSLSASTSTATGLPNGFDTKGYGTPPHLRRYRGGPASVADSEISTSTSRFAKVKAVPSKIQSAAADRIRKQEAEDEDDLDNVAVAPSDSDSD